MKTYLVAYGSPEFNLCLLRLALLSRKRGVDEVRLYTPAHIRATNFYQRHQHILCQPRGTGYWLWKPYIILQTMKEASDGDVVIYCDATADFSVKSLWNTFGGGGQDIFLLKNWECVGVGCRNSQWTKRDAFILMDADQPRYWDAPQVSGSLIAFRNSETTRQFVSEWLDFAKDERILTNILNTQGKDNHLEFLYHRHDQSVLSILAEKHHIGLSAAHEVVHSYRRFDYGIPRTMWLFLRNHNEGMKVLRWLYGTKPWRILSLGFFIMLGWRLPIWLYHPSATAVRIRKWQRIIPVRIIIKQFILRGAKSLTFRTMKIVKRFVMVCHKINKRMSKV